MRPLMLLATGWLSSLLVFVAAFPTRGEHGNEAFNYYQEGKRAADGGTW